METNEFSKALNSQQFGQVIAVLFSKSREEIGGIDSPHVRLYLKPEGCEDVCETVEQFDNA